jgi:hypothetical protein
MRHRFQMLGVATPSVPTQVIQLGTLGDRPNVKLVRDSVRVADRLRPAAHLQATISGFVGESRPPPAPIWQNFDL